MPGSRVGRPGMPLPALVVTLAVAAGAVDAACFTRLGQVFASVMTGNLTLLGLAAAQTSGTLAGRIAVAFLGYAAGAALGSRVTGRPRGAGVAWPSAVTAVLVVELAALAGFTVGWALAGSRPAGVAQFGLLAVGALTMGLQSAAVRAVGTTLSTTYLTGTLTAAVAGLVTGGWSRSSTRWSLAVLVAHAAGAAAAGGLLLTAPAALPALPDAALLAVVAVAMTDRAASRELGSR